MSTQVEMTPEMEPTARTREQGENEAVDMVEGYVPREDEVGEGFGMSFVVEW